MSDLQDLYQDIILDHHRRPRNFHRVEPHTHEAEGLNPMCGDEITVSLRLEDGKIADIGFQGEGCAISRASASIMTEALKGKTLEEAKAEFARVLTFYREDTDEPDLAEVGELAALAGVRQFPMRIKCATLAWHAFSEALEGKASTSTE